MSRSRMRMKRLSLGYSLGWVGLWLGVLGSAGLAGCSDSDGVSKGMPSATGGAGAGGQATDGGSAGDAPNEGGQSGNQEAGPIDHLIESMGGPAAEADWTVFVYGHADHNLSDSFFRDLQEMQAAELEADGRVNLVVLADFDASQMMPESAEHYPSGAVLFLVPGARAVPRVIGQDPELDLDDPEQLVRLTSLVFEAFPSKRRGMVLWDHGGAWERGFGGDQQDGTRAQPTGIAVQKLSGALQSGLKGAGITAEPPLDFFTFDTCVMAGAEVLYPLRSLAALYIANAELDYGDGWNYTTTLSYLAQHPDAGTAELAAAEVAQWNAHHLNAGANDQKLRAHAALDPLKIEALGQAVGKLSAALLSSRDFDIADLARSAYQSEPAYMSSVEERSLGPGLHDLGAVLTSLAASETVPASVADAARQANIALEALPLARSLGTLRRARKQAGFHIELSRGKELTADKLASYGTLASEWAAVSGWDKVLGKIASSADSAPPKVVQTVTNASEAGPSGLPAITFSSPDTDVQSASVLLTVPTEDGKLIVRGYLGGGLVEPNTKYGFEWDGMAVTIGGAAVTVLPWIDGGGDPDALLMQVPGVFDDGHSKWNGQIVFGSTDRDTSTATVVIEVNERMTSIALADFLADSPQMTFTPSLIVKNPEMPELEFVGGDTIAVSGDGALPIALVAVPAGEYRLVTQVLDVWGNQTLTIDPVTLVTAVEQ